MDNVTNAAVNASGVAFIEGYDVSQMFPSTVMGAAENVHTEVDQLLLETKEVDVNAQGGHSGNALQTASSRGHREIVQLLLDKGADVNAQGGEYGNTMQAASMRENWDIVQLLLDKGVYINAQGGIYSNALRAASNWRQHDIVQILVMHIKVVLSDFQTRKCKKDVSKWRRKADPSHHLDGVRGTTS